LPPLLPQTRRWAVDDPAWDASPHAGTTGGRGGGSGGGGGGGGGFGPHGGGAWASSVCRHAQLPQSDARPLLPQGLRGHLRGGSGVAAAAARRVAAIRAFTHDRRGGARPAGVPTAARDGAP